MRNLMDHLSALLNACARVLDAARKTNHGQLPAVLRDEIENLRQTSEAVQAEIGFSASTHPQEAPAVQQRQTVAAVPRARTVHMAGVVEICKKTKKLGIKREKEISNLRYGRVVDQALELYKNESADEASMVVTLAGSQVARFNRVEKGTEVHGFMVAAPDGHAIYLIRCFPAEIFDWITAIVALAGGIEVEQNVVENKIRSSQGSKKSHSSKAAADHHGLGNSEDSSDPHTPKSPGPQVPPLPPIPAGSNDGPAEGNVRENHNNAAAAAPIRPGVTQNVFSAPAPPLPHPSNDEVRIFRPWGGGGTDNPSSSQETKPISGVPNLPFFGRRTGSSPRLGDQPVNSETERIGDIAIENEDNYEIPPEEEGSPTSARDKSPARRGSYHQQHLPLPPGDQEDEEGIYAELWPIQNGLAAPPANQQRMDSNVRQNPHPAMANHPPPPPVKSTFPPPTPPVKSTFPPPTPPVKSTFPPPLPPISPEPMMSSDDVYDYVSDGEDEKDGAQLPSAQPSARQGYPNIPHKQLPLPALPTPPPPLPPADDDDYMEWQGEGAKSRAEGVGAAAAQKLEKPFVHPVSHEGIASGKPSEDEISPRGPPTSSLSRMLKAAGANDEGNGRHPVPGLLTSQKPAAPQQHQFDNRTATPGGIVRHFAKPQAPERRSSLKQALSAKGNIPPTRPTPGPKPSFAHDERINLPGRDDATSVSSRTRRFEQPDPVDHGSGQSTQASSNPLPPERLEPIRSQLQAMLGNLRPLEPPSNSGRMGPPPLPPVLNPGVGQRQAEVQRGTTSYSNNNPMPPAPPESRTARPLPAVPIRRF